jgi:glutathione S-transferase
MAKDTFHIVGHQLCPYVQRVVILMLEKQVPYSRTDIDLNNKPDWLLKISPTAKVPVLVVNGDKVLFESNVICEYLDEVSKSSLYPIDIFDKATHRSWISFGTEILDLIAKIIYQDKSLHCANASMMGIVNRLKIIEKLLADDRYFSSSEFHLIDAVYATIFRYFAVLDLFLKSNPLAKLNKVTSWSKALQQRESVQNAVPENYNQLLVEFIKGKDSFIGQL